VLVAVVFDVGSHNSHSDSHHRTEPHRSVSFMLLSTYDCQEIKSKEQAKGDQVQRRLQLLVELEQRISRGRRKE